jgi:hypothetical protein
LSVGIITTIVRRPLAQIGLGIRAGYVCPHAMMSW